MQLVAWIAYYIIIHNRTVMMLSLQQLSGESSHLVCLLNREGDRNMKSNVYRWLYDIILLLVYRCRQLKRKSWNNGKCSSGFKDRCLTFHGLHVRSSLDYHGINFSDPFQLEYPAFFTTAPWFNRYINGVKNFHQSPCMKYGSSVVRLNKRNQGWFVLDALLMFRSSTASFSYSSPMFSFLTSNH